MSKEKNSAMLRALKKASGLSQTELSLILRISQGQVSKTLRGVYELSLADVILLAEALNFSIQDFQYNAFLSYIPSPDKQKLLPQRFLLRGHTKLILLRSIFLRYPQLAIALDIDIDIFYFAQIKVGDFFLKELQEKIIVLGLEEEIFSPTKAKKEITSTHLIKNFTDIGIYSSVNDLSTEDQKIFRLNRKSFFSKCHIEVLEMLNAMTLYFAINNTNLSLVSLETQKNMLYIELE